MELPQEQDVSQPLLQEDFDTIRAQYESGPSTQTKFNFAWALIRSEVRADQHKGLRLLNEIYKEIPERRRECLYYIALGEYKIKDYKAAKEHLDALLLLEPSNKQAFVLRENAKDKIREGIVG